jgi:hypothetical protein
MNIATYQKIYLGFINIPTLFGFLIPYLSVLFLFYLLGSRGEELLGMLALFCGSVTSFYIMKELDINPLISLANIVLSIIFAALIIMLIHQLTGIQIYL